MNHTPAPWTATFEHERWVIASQGAFGPKKALAVTAGFEPKNGANAALIAAAPELLDALQAMFVTYAAADGPYHPGALAKARAAISKATGEAA